MSPNRIEVTRLDRAVARLVYAQRGRLGPLARLTLRLLGVDLLGTVGPGLVLPHSTTGCVVHPDAVIGSDVTIWHGVTLGRADVWEPAHPDTSIVIGNEVILGANAVVLVRAGQRVTVGDGAVVGANSVVTSDVPAGEVWAGNPARKVSVRA